MSMPQQVLSTQVLSAPFFPPRGIRRSQDLLVDFEEGGFALNDTSKGLQYQVWTGQVLGSGDFTLSAPNTPAVIVITVANVLEWAFTFDQSMNPFFAYTKADGTSYFYWFSPLANAFVTTQLPVGSANCRCSLDDKRAPNSSTSDIVLSYIRAGTLYMRQQRDRYATEYTLSAALTGKRQVNAGLNTKFRYQFEITP
jgi:hypothetical protein